MNEDLFKEIIRSLDRSTSPNKKWSDKIGNCWFLCPFHSDNEQERLSNGEKEFNCFSCGESENHGKSAIQIGIEIRKFCDQGLILDDYELLKKLTCEFLETLEISDCNQYGSRVLRIPYFDENDDDPFGSLRIRLNCYIQIKATGRIKDECD